MSQRITPLIDPDTGELLRSQERKYLRAVRISGRFTCLQCGGDLNEVGQYGSFTHEAHTIYQDVVCGKCGAKWTDAYELDRIVLFVASATAAASA